jgi:hypothetical protein
MLGVQCSMFDVQFLFIPRMILAKGSVSISIKLVDFQASGSVDTYPFRLCRSASYMVTAAATEALSESRAPG